MITFVYVSTTICCFSPGFWLFRESFRARRTRAIFSLSHEEHRNRKTSNPIAPGRLSEHFVFILQPEQTTSTRMFT